MGLMLGLGLAFGALGAGFGIFSGLNRSWEEQEEIAAQKEAEKRMREAQIQEQKAAAERDIAYAKSAFKIEQEDAIRKAGDIWHQGERLDDKSDLDETLTGRAFNLAVKKDKIADDNALRTEQRGRQNFAHAQGQMKAALGLSGTRAGTNSAEALLEQNAQNFDQDLSLMQNQRKAERETNLMSAWASLRSGMQRIDETRDAANMAFRDSKQLKADYSDGGRAVNLFNQKIDNRRADLQGNINLQNLGGYFKQQALSRAYDRAGYGFLDGLTDLFNGFSSGFNFGSGVANFANNWATPAMTAAAGTTQGASSSFNAHRPYSEGLKFLPNSYLSNAQKVRNPFDNLF